ncbi:hypothetical protein L2E82_18118 [Cichorium intybus]|uniref:Uncharacterized protein n=1 Tax=Cichorium intybus TaxID=13427 RepID=A0ACB9FA24_CICIN|nr:hypothetical protein L2E82_18118 [Cichorium intybus]
MLLPLLLVNSFARIVTEPPNSHLEVVNRRSLYLGCFVSMPGLAILVPPPSIIEEYALIASRIKENKVVLLQNHLIFQLEELRAQLQVLEKEKTDHIN